MGDDREAVSMAFDALFERTQTKTEVAKKLKKKKKKLIIGKRKSKSKPEKLINDAQNGVASVGTASTKPSPTQPLAKEMTGTKKAPRGTNVKKPALKRNPKPKATIASASPILTTSLSTVLTKKNTKTTAETKTKSKTKTKTKAKRTSSRKSRSRLFNCSHDAEKCVLCLVCTSCAAGATCGYPMNHLPNITEYVAKTEQTGSEIQTAVLPDTLLMIQSPPKRVTTKSSETIKHLSKPVKSLSPKILSKTKLSESSCAGNIHILKSRRASEKHTAKHEQAPVEDLKRKRCELVSIWDTIAEGTDSSLVQQAGSKSLEPSETASCLNQLQAKRKKPADDGRLNAFGFPAYDDATPLNRLQVKRKKPDGRLDCESPTCSNLQQPEHGDETNFEACNKPEETMKQDDIVKKQDQVSLGSDLYYGSEYWTGANLLSHYVNNSKDSIELPTPPTLFQ